jgi:hypothetical protein
MRRSGVARPPSASSPLGRRIARARGGKGVVGPRTVSTAGILAVRMQIAADGRAAEQDWGDVRDHPMENQAYVDNTVMIAERISFSLLRFSPPATEIKSC